MSGLKILMMGEPGCGKTHSIVTLSRSPHIERIFILFTDPGGDSTLRKVISDSGADLSKFHWRYVSSVAPSWADMMDGARKINQLSNESLQKLEGLNRSGYTQFIDLLSQMAAFKDERTGQDFGEVDKFTDKDVLVVDTLSGVNDMALRLKVGGKPIRSQPDWGAAMDAEENFIQRLVYSLSCHVILNAHIETEPDAITGSSRIMVALLGRKLAPKIPRLFDEVILSRRDGTKFFWSTATSNAVVKTRHFPFSETITPDYVPLIEMWTKFRLPPESSVTSTGDKPTATAAVPTP